MSICGTLNVKFANAKQAKKAYQYRNTKKKLYKINVANGITKYAESSILTTLADTKRTTLTNTCCCVYSIETLLMMESGLVQNM